MCVITALVDIGTLLEPAFNDYIDTVFNSPIYFLSMYLSVLFIYFPFDITLEPETVAPAPDSSSHFRNIFVYSAHKEVPSFWLWL